MAKCGCGDSYLFFVAIEDTIKHEVGVEHWPFTFNVLKHL